MRLSPLRRTIPYHLLLTNPGALLARHLSLFTLVSPPLSLPWGWKTNFLFLLNLRSNVDPLFSSLLFVESRLVKRLRIPIIHLLLSPHGRVLPDVLTWRTLPQDAPMFSSSVLDTSQDSLFSQLVPFFLRQRDQQTTLRYPQTRKEGPPFFRSTWCPKFSLFK